MRIFHHFPVPDLAPYIERFWGWEADDGEELSLPIVLPGTGADMFFHYQEPFRLIDGEHVVALDDTHLLCVRRRLVELARMREAGFVAIRFRAGALHHFVQVPGAELIDQRPRASDLWGHGGKELAMQVRSAPSNRIRADLLQDFLLRRLDENARIKAVSTAASGLYRQCDTLAVTALAARMGSSLRSMERLFLRTTGQTLVEMRRLGRFQKTARTLLLNPAASTTDCALMNGYYDQSHFNREFKALAALSPLAFLARARKTTHFYNTPRA